MYSEGPGYFDVGRDWAINACEIIPSNFQCKVWSQSDVRELPARAGSASATGPADHSSKS